MHIRIAEKKDYLAVINIYNHAVDETSSTADTEYVTTESKKKNGLHGTQKTYPIFIVEENDGIVSWCALNQHRPGRKTLITIAASGLFSQTR